MGKNSIEIENDVFSCKQKDDVAFVTFKNNAIEFLTNTKVRNELFYAFSIIEDSQTIKGVVITNTSEYTYDANLKRFFTHTIEALESGAQYEILKRFKDSLKQLAKFFNNITKPTVAALNGNIGEALLAIILSCDFRYATSNTIFHIQTVKLGLPTIGVLAFYLVNYSGLPRSIDILLTKTSLSAPEAHDLGLLTDVTANDELMSRSVKKLNDMRQYPSYSISAMKRILRPDINDIYRFIDRAFEEFGFNLKEIKKTLSDSK